jgi:hypothetical protein
VMKQTLWRPCSDAENIISTLERLDGYPYNEQSD